MLSNARVAGEPDSLISELEDWAERFHHLSVNCALIAMEGDEDVNPTKLAAMADAYGNASEFIFRRIAELTA